MSRPIAAFALSSLVFGLMGTSALAEAPIRLTSDFNTIEKNSVTIDRMIPTCQENSDYKPSYPQPGDGRRWNLNFPKNHSNAVKLLQIFRR